MIMKMPIFEETISVLYYSNDGLLHVRAADGEYFILHADPDTGPVDTWSEAEEVFRTRDRIKADAFIAGYDFARENRDRFGSDPSGFTRV
jgi:pyruvate carboxylase